MDADLERIRKARRELVLRNANELISRFKTFGIKLKADHVDRRFLGQAIDDIAEEYVNALVAYKVRNGYADGDRVQPTKIAAFLSNIIARKRPIRTGSGTVSLEASLANAYLSWRIIQVLLHIDVQKAGNEFVEHLVRSLHHIDTNSGNQIQFQEDWMVLLMEAMIDAYGRRHAYGQDVG